jgi:uncharacterized protein with NAD-binding domain and iron-sulfur cluster
MGSPKKVVILGGGIAGLSAAHELIERGFAVEVYERRAVPGGKARSVDAASAARTPPGASPLPGEHGFRFFPRFYTHVVDTMKRIPHAGGSVADNLVETTQVLVAPFDRPSFVLPPRFPQAPEDVKTILFASIAALAGQFEVPPGEASFFAQKMWQIATSCEERRLLEYERINWWDFIEADTRSFAYQTYLGSANTRSLVAAKARRASTKTVGDMFLQMVFDVFTPGVSTDRVLNGPTSEVWLEPWLTFLRGRGVAYHLGADVRAIHCERGVVRAATIAFGARVQRVEADYFIAALPVERMAELLSPELLAADPSLGNLNELTEYVEWMNGIQFYLREDVPLAHGHAIYVDSPWALTSISQAQFWKGVDLTRRGDGEVKGLLSVDVSDWDVKGLNGKEAQECSREEIAMEVWTQLKRSLNNGRELLRDDQLHSWFLDPDIAVADPSVPNVQTNAEPLLVNYVDTWRLRPEAVTRIPNLFLASDYVRTYTDLATMEAANEAARRAVNGILHAARSDASPCRLWNLHEPEPLLPVRAFDRLRFRRGLPWDSSSIALGRATLELVGHASASTGALAGDDTLLRALDDAVRQAVGKPAERGDAPGMPSASQAETAAAARASSDVGLRQLRIVEDP